MPPSLPLNVSDIPLPEYVWEEHIFLQGQARRCLQHKPYQALPDGTEEAQAYLIVCKRTYKRASTGGMNRAGGKPAKINQSKEFPVHVPT
jgi:hypothetical protein